RTCEFLVKYPPKIMDVIVGKPSPPVTDTVVRRNSPSGISTSSSEILMGFWSESSPSWARTFNVFPGDCTTYGVGNTTSVTSAIPKTVHENNWVNSRGDDLRRFTSPSSRMLCPLMTTTPTGLTPHRSRTQQSHSCTRGAQRRDIFPLKSTARHRMMTASLFHKYIKALFVGILRTPTSFTQFAR